MLLEQLARLLARASASSIDRRIRSRRSSIVFWIGPKAYFFSTKSVIANAISVQIIRPGTTLIRALAATSGLHCLDEDVGEQAADEAVEHDRLGECEAEPLDALKLPAQLGLPGD